MMKDERIAKIRGGRWIGYARAEAINRFMPSAYPDSVQT